MFLSTGLATLLNIGLETGEPDDEVAEAIRNGAQETVGQTGEKIVRQQLAQPPTLT